MAVATMTAGGGGGSVWERLNRYSDLMLAAAVCAIVGMMIIPLPEWMLDLLIITNLSLGLMMLVVELNAGAINEETARSRRRAVQKEADFYGAMDGASKFVKGDAIAAIIIMIINIVAGFVIGVVQLKMQLGDALSVYTLLTVGEGLT